MFVCTIYKWHLLKKFDSSRMGDCQLDDLLDMLEDDDDFEETNVDDPEPVEGYEDDGDAHVEEEVGDDGAEEEMAKKLREMEEEVHILPSNNFISVFYLPHR